MGYKNIIKLLCYADDEVLIAQSEGYLQSHLFNTTAKTFKHAYFSSETKLMAIKKIPPSIKSFVRSNL